MAVGPRLGKLVPLAVGFQLISCCQCFDQFGTNVVTDATPLGFSMLETPEPSPFSLDVPGLQNAAKYGRRKNKDLTPMC